MRGHSFFRDVVPLLWWRNVKPYRRGRGLPNLRIEPLLGDVATMVVVRVQRLLARRCRDRVELAVVAALARRNEVERED